MKVDVKIAGTNYTEVLSILLPLTAGGKARFCEVSDTTAEIGDVARGKSSIRPMENWCKEQRTYLLVGILGRK
jgi:hypothetical protein